MFAEFIDYIKQKKVVQRLKEFRNEIKMVSSNQATMNGLKHESVTSDSSITSIIAW